MEKQRTLTTIVSYPERGEGGSNRYRGNCSPKLIEDLLAFYKPEEICDYMCGSGTTGAAAEHMGVPYHLYDLHSGFDLLSCEIQERPDFIFFHPPYWSIITYSDVMYSAKQVEERYGYDPRKLDLSRIEEWPDFLRALNTATLRQFAALEKGGRLAVLMGDIKKKGKLYSMLLEMTKPGTIEQIIIKAQHNTVSGRRNYSGKFIPIEHEYVLILRKDNPLLIPALISREVQTDIRDWKNATWKDVVYAVLKESGREMKLDDLYRRIDGHKRAQNPHWQAKVRQTLQLHPDLFCHVQRGVWALAS